VPNRDQSRENGASSAADPDGIDLSPRLQNRNVLLYATLTALIFLSAPTLYVGFVQAGLCKRLNASDTVANIPATAFLAMVWVPVVVAWLIPQARLLKRTLRIAYGVMALVCGIVAAILLTGAPSPVIIGALIVHAAILSGANGVVLTLGWETIGRGMSEKRRGKAFSLAFGVGAAFAVIGSLSAQLLLDGKVLGWIPPAWLKVSYPYNYAILFLCSATFMAIASQLARFYSIPLPKIEAQRQSFNVAILGGFKAILRNKNLRYICLAYLLVYFGNMVQVNMSLFTKEAVGVPSETLVGYQLALRFSFKIMAGALLGWVLTRTCPKIPLFVTLGLLMACVLWVLYVPGYWFLVAFGLNGAGELFGVYYVNYAVSSSPKSQVRRNLSLLFCLSAVVGFAPVFYGWISDHWGLRTSFWVALAVLACTALLVGFKLPKRPEPSADDLSDADTAEKQAAAGA
jgi:MFS family permease